MLPKASIVSIGVHDEVLNWVAKNKPVSIVIVNERGESRPDRPWEANEIDGIRRAMDASPKTLWVFRSWPDGIGEGPEQLLSWRIWKCFEPFMDMSNPKMAHSYNEPGFPWIQASGDARALAHLESDFAQQVHGFGLLSMNFCFSESHLLRGNVGLWEIYAEALPYVDALGFNEYDRPGSDTWDAAFLGDYYYRLGHWEEQRKRILKIAGSCLPIILGEGLVDMKVQGGQKGGWRTLGWSAKRYIDFHQTVYNDSYHLEGLFSHHTFCYPQPYDWQGYSVKPILAELGNLVRDAPKVYWEEKEEPMPSDLWKNVPPQIARWRPLIEKCTREYPVPIPDYKGIHVSPAKVITCIIRLESNGNPEASSGWAQGLMQVWKEHYPGVDLFNPEINIRVGLQVLERKLAIAKGNLWWALYYYSGGTYWDSTAEYDDGYWGAFARFYKEFWGVDLEPNEDLQKKYEDLYQAATKARDALKAALG